MSKRILVVEDQPDNRQIIRDMLARTDYEITEAENGEEALAAIAKQRPDLILMDIQLPIMDGYTAVSRIKADPALRSIPIIAVTSYALNGEEKKARAAGCDDYVPKPFSPRQLLAKFVSTSNSGVVVFCDAEADIEAAEPKPIAHPTSTIYRRPAGGCAPDPVSKSPSTHCRAMTLGSPWIRFAAPARSVPDGDRTRQRASVVRCRARTIE